MSFSVVELRATLEQWVEVPESEYPDAVAKVGELLGSHGRILESTYGWDVTLVLIGRLQARFSPDLGEALAALASRVEGVVEAAATHITALPPELRMLVCQHLGQADIANLRLVDRSHADHFADPVWFRDSSLPGEEGVDFERYFHSMREHGHELAGFDRLVERNLRLQGQMIDVKDEMSRLLKNQIHRYLRYATKEQQVALFEWVFHERRSFWTFLLHSLPPTITSLVIPTIYDKRPWVARLVQLLPNLEELELREFYWIDKRLADSVKEHGQRLRILAIRDCDATDRQVIPLLQSAPKLTRLDLSGNPSLTDETLETIRGFQGELQVLYLGGTEEQPNLEMSREALRGLAKSLPDATIVVTHSWPELMEGAG